MRQQERAMTGRDQTSGKTPPRATVRAAAPVALGAALVIEDDPIIALSVADALRAGGADPVETCASTEAAREALERLAPAIVVLDVHLADRADGWAFAELLQVLGPNRPRVIFATAAPHEIPPEVAAMGTVLTKPFAPEEILTALQPRRAPGLLRRLRGA
jgi:CheY-like chemotaxis protein